MVNAMAVTSVIKGVGLHWFHLSLVLCVVCKNFGHMSLSCRFVKNAAFLSGKRASLLAQDQLRLVRIYTKKSTSISHPLVFGNKTWALVAGASSTPLPSGSNIESSLISLVRQIGELAKRLDSLMLANPEGDIVIGTVLGETAVIVDLSVFPQVTRLENMLERLFKSVLSLSAHFESSLVWKVATCNIRGINNPAKQDDIIYWHNNINNLISIFTETKLMRRVRSWIINKFDDVRVFTSGLDSGYLDASVVIFVDFSLVRHVCKVSEVPGWLLSIKLLFKNKLSVSILGLYAGASLVVQFSQTGKINSLITKAVNESSFIILGGDFNENGLHKSMSFRKCLNLGLVNSLLSSPVVKSPILVNAIVHHDVLKVSKHYDMDYQTVSKFDFKSADKIRWNNFKGATLANTTMFSNEFVASTQFSDLDAMWDIVHKIMVFSAGEVFKKKWFKDFDNVFTKESSRFHKLKLLVSKIVKVSCKKCVANFESLMGCWVSLNDDKTSVVQSVVDSGAGTNDVCSALFSARRSYHPSKLTESLRAKEANIRSIIDKRIKSFEVVLDHLVVSNELVLESDLVKSKVDDIIEGWTRKHVVVNDAFSEVMCAIDFDELHHVVSNLSDGKAIGLSVLGLLLVLLNSCLSCESAWISMIPKPYEWEDVLTNTCSIALIETACKILSKILSNRISLVCSSHDVLHNNNFSVLKSTMTQSPIFAIGSVVEDTLEKN
ncbi:hypothetical protein G9A89_000070 [Geosiphon pyriformis]|nr:hypothetical protein G9A89_000070 [Geosiphon pyriformis]